MNAYAYSLVVLLPYHVLFLVFLISFYKEFSLYHLFMFFVFWTLFSGFGIGVGYHRLLAHMSFRTSKFWERVCSYLGCFGLQGPPIYWVGLHTRMHHKFSDTEKDLHSPVNGMFRSYIGWTFDLDETEFIRGRLLSDRFQRALYVYYPLVIGIPIMIAYVYLPDVVALSLVPAMLFTLHQEFVVNTFCHVTHMGGTRAFETNDNSVNRSWLGLLWGVGYHNNHHAYPHEYDFGKPSGQWDPTKYLVELIRKA